MRKITAKGMDASAMAGRIRCLKASHAASHSRVSNPSSTKRPVTRVALMPTLSRPDGGSQPSCTAKTSRRTKARKKTGTATPTSEVTTAPVSSAVPRLRAAR